MRTALTILIVSVVLLLAAMKHWTPLHRHRTQPPPSAAAQQVESAESTHLASTLQLPRHPHRHQTKTPSTSAGAQQVESAESTHLASTLQEFLKLRDNPSMRTIGPDIEGSSCKHCQLNDSCYDYKV